MASSSTTLLMLQKHVIIKTQQPTNIYPHSTYLVKGDGRYRHKNTFQNLSDSAYSILNKSWCHAIYSWYYTDERIQQFRRLHITVYVFFVCLSPQWVAAHTLQWSKMLHEGVLFNFWQQYYTYFYGQGLTPCGAVHFIYSHVASFLNPCPHWFNLLLEVYYPQQKYPSHCFRLGRRVISF